MKILMTIAAGTFLVFSQAALAEGDAAAGEKIFKKCRACHAIVNGDEVIFKGGKVGPNLYGVVGRAAGNTDYKYSASMLAAGETGLVWTQELIAQFVLDPKAYLQEFTGDSSAKTKMTLKLKKGGEYVAAYLASVAPPAQ